MKALSIICLLIFIFVCGFSQNYVDIAKFYAGSSALNKFDNSESATRVNEFGFELTLPVVINPKDAFLTGLIYERIQAKLYAAEPEATISVIGLRAGLSKKYSEKWSGTLLIIPKIASDFDHIGKRDFQIGVIALMKYTRRENKSFRFGMYYNSELFGPFVVPVVGVYYLSPDGKFETNITLPFLADMNYKIQERVQLGLNFNGQIRSYHLTQVASKGKPGYLVKASNELYTYLKFNITQGLSIQARLGYTIGRSYRVYDDGDRITVGSVLVKVGDDRTQLNSDFANGFIYQAMVLYRFKTS